LDRRTVKSIFETALDVVQALIDAGAAVYKANANKSTPLFVAATKRNLAVVRALAAAADVVIVPTLPLLVAAQHGLPQYFPLLPPALASRGAEPDPRGRRGPAAASGPGDPGGGRKGRRAAVQQVTGNRREV
jgi:hypothetical protein